ncbi:MAG: hypothetical protein JNL40_08745 [Cyclobacteriaceae bacterium]|nr:hypothetical protein [Cyclobacteriaceae bacterium]
MMKITFLLLLVALSAAGQNPQLNVYLTESRQFIAQKDYVQAYDRMMSAHALHPYHQGILYQLGVLCALTNRPEESITYLRKAIQINAGFKLADQPDLATLKDRADFRSLLELQKKLQLPIVSSDTAVVLRDRTLHIEAVTVDPATGTFYLGSIHRRKIVKVDPQGNASDFTSAGANGMTAVFGVRVDPKKNVLWACSSPIEEMQDYDSTAKSAVFQFDLKSGKQVRQYIPAVKKGHVLGDLVLNSRGEVFVSDSKNNVIFKVNEQTGSLDLFFESSEFWNLQGITFSPDGRYLFISDYIKGPYRLDMKTRALVKIQSSIENSLKGIDGLTFYDGSLIALQNGTSPLRATRYVLNGPMDTIIGATLIDQAHPAMNEPTIGTVDDHLFYYVANSQWGGYDDAHRQKPETELHDIVILKAKLR